MFLREKTFYALAIEETIFQMIKHEPQVVFNKTHIHKHIHTHIVYSR